MEFWKLNLRVGILEIKFELEIWELNWGIGVFKKKISWESEFWTITLEWNFYKN